MAALLTVHSSGALSEDPAVEVPVSRLLHAPSQPTVRALEATLVELQETLQMMSQRAVQNRTLRVPGSVGPHTS